MATIKIAGIKRDIRFSPNHIGNDGMIFNLVGDHLREKGYEIEEFTEAEFLISKKKVKYIFNLAREKRTIKALHKLSRDGATIINSPTGIDNCVRESLTRLFIRNKIPYPASVIIDVDEDPTEKLELMDAPAYWVKRGDSHTIHREDVTYARNIAEVKSILSEFGLRGIPNAVVNKHLVGELVKFYGVADTDFFYWFYPYDLNHSKFGYEENNEPSHNNKFSVDELKAACDKATKVLDVQIYGGDCIVDKDGSFKIIDFNDWPSFAPCRELAAPIIAEYIHNSILMGQGNKETGWFGRLVNKIK